MKKGQMTLFIILGVIIVLIIALIGYFVYTGDFVSNSLGEIESISDDVALFESYVDDCSDEALDLALYSLGSNIFVYDLNLESMDTGDPYFYKDGREQIPSVSDIERAMDSHILEDITFCVDSKLVNHTESIEVIDLDVSTSLTEVSILEVSWQARFYDSIDSYAIDSSTSFTETVDVESFLSFAQEYIQYYEENSEAICTDCIIAYYEEYGYVVSTDTLVDGQVIDVVDQDVGGVSYTFSFGVE